LGELIGGSMYEVAPGKKQGPYHTHHGNEEWAIVIRGRPTRRTPEGEPAAHDHPLRVRCCQERLVRRARRGVGLTGSRS
jgi:hypothetical protein